MRDNLDRLEAESIEIFREVFAQFAKPVLLYSIGKDSSVLLHLALKACHPAPLPLPLLHIDTGWKFRAMIAFRDEMARRLGLELIVHTNEEGRRKGVVPFGPGASHYTDIMKTEALRAALELHAFDAAIGGARRDEEASRAKERIFSVRQRGYRWSPERQRPELWRIYNGRLDTGQTMRVFPLSNWTEGDVWAYIRRESIPVVDLYLTKPRPVVARGGMLIMRDDERMPLEPGEAVETKMVRFRTLGCYPLTGAVESAAESIDDVLAELSASRFSERQARQIDKDGPAAMERKKVEGYF